MDRVANADLGTATGKRVQPFGGKRHRADFAETEKHTNDRIGTDGQAFAALRPRRFDEDEFTFEEVDHRNVLLHACALADAPARKNDALVELS